MATHIQHTVVHVIVHIFIIAFNYCINLHKFIIVVLNFKKTIKISINNYAPAYCKRQMFGEAKV